MMAKVDPIIITLEDTKEQFTLDFNRDSVRFAERNGFNIADMENKPMSTVYDLFYYAFRMNHRNVARQKTDKIIDDYFGGIAGLPDALMQRLGELYAQTFTALTDEGAVKNGKATVQM